MTTAFRRISAIVLPIIERECYVSRSEILSRAKSQSIVMGRQWFYWSLLRAGLSAGEIGRGMDRADHTNAIRGARQCAVRQRMHPHEAERAERILKELEGVRV